MMQFPMFGKLEPKKHTAHCYWGGTGDRVGTVSEHSDKTDLLSVGLSRDTKKFRREAWISKPISKEIFIFMAIVGIVLAVLFLSAFLRHAVMTVMIAFLVLAVSGLIAAKFYTPPFKAFAMAQHLKYGGELVSGQYNGRNIFIVEGKKRLPTI